MSQKLETTTNYWKRRKIGLTMNYRKCPNLVLTQVEIISDPNYLVRILFER